MKYLFHQYEEFLDNVIIMHPCYTKQVQCRRFTNINPIKCARKGQPPKHTHAMYNYTLHMFPCAHFKNQNMQSLLTQLDKVDQKQIVLIILNHCTPIQDKQLRLD